MKMESRLFQICQIFRTTSLEFSSLNYSKCVTRHYHGLPYGFRRVKIKSSLWPFSLRKSTNANVPTATVLFTTAASQERRVKHKHNYEAIDIVDFSESEPGRQNCAKLNFSCAVTSFEQKTTRELLRAVIVLHLCSLSTIADNSLKLMALSQRVLGRRLFERLMQATFFGQFALHLTTASGDCRSQKTLQRFHSVGIHPMILLSLEEDIGEDPGLYNEARYDRNRDTMIKCIHLQASMAKNNTFPQLSQLKITSYIKADLLAKLTELLEAKGLGFSNTTPISYQNCAEGMDGGMEVVPELDHEEMAHFNTAMVRINTIVENSVSRNVKILVDAEKTNINPAMTMITLALMSKYNRRSPHVWNTYQCYLKSTYDNVLQDIALAEQYGFRFGAKVVRGAYMDQERQHAMDENRADPVNPTLEATNDMYDRVVSHLLKYLSVNGRNKCNFIVATHNEDSILKAVQRMQELGIPMTSTAVVFGQLYGMCDHVSYTLGKAGYHIYKSIPLGEVDDVLPYLSRRAQENQTMFNRLTKEKTMIRDELRNRLIPGRRTKTQAN